jgi:Tetracyclin repressor-like, C-terminal domain
LLAPYQSTIAGSSPTTQASWPSGNEVISPGPAIISIRFGSALDAIDRKGGDAAAKLDAYAGVYADVLRRRRMCLCGMLAADYDTLPKPMRSAVTRFFDQNEAWLVGVLEQGVREGALDLTGTVHEEAQAIISGLEGAMLVARPYGDLTRFAAAARRLLPPAPARGATRGRQTRSAQAEGRFGSGFSGKKAT